MYDRWLHVLFNNSTEKTNEVDIIVNDEVQNSIKELLPPLVRVEYYTRTRFHQCHYEHRSRGTLKETEKRGFNVIKGSWNAETGNGKHVTIVKDFGLRTRNGTYDNTNYRSTESAKNE